MISFGGKPFFNSIFLALYDRFYCVNTVKNVLDIRRAVDYLIDQTGNMPIISILKYVLITISFVSSFNTIMGLYIYPPNLSDSLAVIRNLSFLKNFRYLILSLCILLNFIRFTWVYRSHISIDGDYPHSEDATNFLNFDI